jgi:tetratricopeptide (TPR) repeat protein
VDVVDAIHRALELQLERRHDEAIEILLAAAKEHDDEDLHFEIANHYAQRGLQRADAKAAADFDEADKWADLPLTKAGRAAMTARSGDLDRAEALSAEALEMDPELPMGHTARGVVRLRQGKAQEAVESLAKAVELGPGSGLAWALLTEALTAAGKPEFAAKAMAEGLRHCPADDRLLVVAARAYLAQEEVGRAKRALELAAEQNPENVDAWRGLASIAAKDGDENSMIRAVDRAMAIDREGTVAWMAKENLQQ